ncbi:MAG: hypothetical protein ACRC7O_14520 [Fimbriiglobus sp.]
MFFFFRKPAPPLPPGPPPRLPARRPARPWVVERRWGVGGRPLPVRWVLPDGVAAPRKSPKTGFDITAKFAALCRDIAVRCPELSHIDMSRVLVTFTPSRTKSRFGLQARVTPMRCRDGALTRRFRGHTYQIQRYHVDGREVLYLVTFCLPRLLDQPFREKMVTVFHELYHIGTGFDGDLRRHPGRYTVHTHSKHEYDQKMAELAGAYLDGHPDPGVFDFLRLGYADLWRATGGLSGVVVPRPKLVPAG